MALSGHCYVVCVKRRSPSFSGSQQQSNPIRVRRWWQASGLFNSPPNDIRASWSALMITHSTNLSLHQHPLHKGPAWAKRVCVCVCVYVCVCVCVCDLTLQPRTVWVLYYLKDSIIPHSLCFVATPPVILLPKTHCRDYYVCPENIRKGPDFECVF